jgi:hypothetical protein
MTVAIATATAVVPRLWPGETFAVIGGGSSLTAADCAYVRGKARVVAIKEAAVCSLPHITPPAPWADVLYAADAKWWKFEQGAPGFAGLKYGIEQEPGVTQRDWPGVQILRNTGSEGLELDPSGLKTGYNSGAQAINLAVHLGAAKIVLLGFDCWRGLSGQQNWFGPHPAHIDSSTVYPVFLQGFASMVDPLKAAGVSVVNASRFTLLNAFPRVVLEEALP